MYNRQDKINALYYDEQSAEKLIKEMKLYQFPEQSINFMVDNNTVDEELLAAEISRLSGIGMDVVETVLKRQEECLVKVGIIQLA